MAKKQDWQVIGVILFIGNSIFGLYNLKMYIDLMPSIPVSNYTSQYQMLKKHLLVKDIVDYTNFKEPFACQIKL